MYFLPMKDYPDYRSEELQVLITLCGGVTGLSKRLRVSRQAVSKWHKVPWKHLFKVSEISGVSVKEIMTINEKAK